MAQAAYACALFCGAIWLGLYATGRRSLNRIWRETWGLGAGGFAVLGIVFQMFGLW
ncbi:MAG: hypothetical protein AAGF60_07160 [Pseudomonadota bacterium]